MRTPIIIGLVGPSGAGKTTVCDYIQSFGFMKIHIAQPLKRGFCAMFKVPAPYTEQPLIEQPAAFLGGVAPRVILEHLGNRLHEIAPMALPLSLEQRLINMKRLSNPWILADGMRRNTEAEVVWKHGGKIIRIEGKPIDPDKPCDVTQQDVEADFTVHFSPTPEGLHRQLDEVLAELLPKGAIEDARGR